MDSRLLLIDKTSCCEAVSGALHRERLRRGMSRESFIYTVIDLLRWNPDKRSTVEKWIDGANTPKLPTLMRLSALLGDTFLEDWVMRSMGRTS